MEELEEKSKGERERECVRVWVGVCVTAEFPLYEKIIGS